MNIIGGHTVEVYRSTRDRFGDVITETFVGTVDNVVYQWTPRRAALQVSPIANFQETWDSSSVMFFPRDTDVAVQDKDRIRLAGSNYQVVGDRAWDEDHPATGYDFGYYMVQVEVVG